MWARNQSKRENGLMIEILIESSHASCLQLNKLEKISFSNMVDVKISAAFECISTHSTPADTKLDTVRFYQI